jgi:nitrogenase molybdenum-cofactor synthesis protein NifE
MQISQERKNATIEDDNELRGILRNRTLTGVFQSATWQNHRYGINCKLSGSVYAASEIEDAIPILHGPAGCAFHQRLTPMKIYAPIYDLPSTNLDENDVIYGGENKLREKINEVYHQFHPSLIVLLPTCISGLIGDDISGLCQDIKPELPCDLVHVASEGFAHRSRESLDGLMQDTSKSWKTLRPPEYDLRGCGQEEVILSLVDQLMEEQDVIDNLVNLETFGRFRYGSRKDLGEIKRIFGDIGINVNMTIPSCTVEEIKRAPAAQLNIITRNRKAAKRMKEKFGTDYYRKWASHYGIEGIERFFLEVSSKLNLEGEAEDVIKREKSKALEKLDKYRGIFKKYDFAVSTQGFFFTPYFARIFVQDLGLPIRYFCVNTQLLRSMNTSEKTIGSMMKSLEGLFADWDFRFEMVVNPTANEMSEIAKKVDYMLSDRIMPFLCNNEDEIGMMDISAITNLLFRTSFTGIVEFSRYFASSLNSRAIDRRRVPIISRFNYDQINYPLIDDPRCSASQSMWQDMWGLKSSAGGD